MTKLFDVVAVNIKTGATRMIVAGKAADADLDGALRRESFIAL